MIKPNIVWFNCLAFCLYYTNFYLFYLQSFIILLCLMTDDFTCPPQEDTRIERVDKCCMVEDQINKKHVYKIINITHAACKVTVTSHI